MEVQNGPLDDHVALDGPMVATTSMLTRSDVVCVWNPSKAKELHIGPRRFEGCHPARLYQGKSAKMLRPNAGMQDFDKAACHHIGSSERARERRFAWQRFTWRLAGTDVGGNQAQKAHGYEP